jgi:hypothetical protein
MLASASGTPRRRALTFRHTQEFGPDFLTHRASLTRLPYMEAVIAETMRVLVGQVEGSNALALSKRIPPVDTRLGDFMLPAGTRVIFTSGFFVNGRAEFAEADGGAFDMSFYPDRFIQVWPIAAVIFGIVTVIVTVTPLLNQSRFKTWERCEVSTEILLIYSFSSRTRDRFALHVAVILLFLTCARASSD